MKSKLASYHGTAALSKHFDFIKRSSHQGVRGVWKIKSGKPGPVLGITIHTHGNEPSGLAVLSHFRNIFPLQQHLKKGTVFFVLNNIRATEKFLAASSDNEKRASRFIDLNMNRLPNDTMVHGMNDPRYEVRRAYELRNIWSQFDFALDIHSTATETIGMIMNIGSIHRNLIRGFPITDIITNIENVQIGKPAVSFYGKGSIPVMGIEAGCHESAESFERAITCTDSLLKNLKMIDGETVSGHREYNEYCVGGSLIFPDASYSLVKVFQTYDRFTEGEKIASGAQGDIFAPFTGHSIFAGPNTTVKSLEEEVMFYLRPPKVITID